MALHSNNDPHFVSAFSVYLKSAPTGEKGKSNQERGVNKVAPNVPKQCKISQNLKKRVQLLRNNVLKKPVSRSSVKKKIHSVIKHEKQAGREITLKKSSHQIIKQNSNEFMLSDDPIEDSGQLFKWMLDPILPKGFFETYWEQKALYISRDKEDNYAHILTTSELDKIVRNNNLFYTRNVDVVSYENGVKEVHNPEGKVTTSALWDYYSNGCSVRILNPQTYNYKVHLLLATLQEYFGTMVGANVYLTPPNSQGFAPHYDDIEAFILQLEGRKHWKLYQPKSNNVLARFSSPNLKHENIGQPFMELTLNAGELLYFPRGTIHEGFTDSDSHSLHITISVYQQTSYVDLLEHALPAALKKASEHDVNFRKGLPLNYLKHLGVATSSENSKLKNFICNKIENLFQSLMQYLDVDSAADLLGKKLTYDSMPPVLSKDEASRCSKADGSYLRNGQVVNKIQFDLDTRIRLLRYYCVRLVREDSSSLKLYYSTENANMYHGEEEQWLELDSAMLSTIRMLQKAYPRYMTVDQLPIDDQILKLQLISDLWERGIIITESSLKSVENN